MLALAVGLVAASRVARADEPPPGSTAQAPAAPSAPTGSSVPPSTAPAQAPTAPVAPSAPEPVAAPTAPSAPSAPSAPAAPALPPVTRADVAVSAPRAAEPSSPPAPAPPTLDPNDESAPERRKVFHQYRKGFMLGLSLGAGVGAGSGYPNDVQKIGNPDFYSQTPALLGSTFQLVVGGALTDYLSFGVLFGGASFKNSEWEARASGFGFRIDVYPAVLALPKVKALANLGLGADLGAGMIKVQALGNYPTVEGFQSILGVSAFYEFRLFSLLGGHVSLSPELAYHAAYHTSSQVNYLSAAARLVFYGGP
ncbi:MAG: hypothetical protein U0183_05025 [Polyangiaceae bacterium]